jgi:hypothetical protein
LIYLFVFSHFLYFFLPCIHLSILLSVCLSFIFPSFLSPISSFSFFPCKTENLYAEIFSTFSLFYIFLHNLECVFSAAQLLKRNCALFVGPT